MEFWVEWEKVKDWIWIDARKMRLVGSYRGEIEFFIEYFE